MGNNYQRIQQVFTIFGFLVLGFSIWEFFQNVYPQSQGLMFIAQAILGILLIFVPEYSKKLLKVQLPNATVYFYWFFLLISVFMGTILHLIEIVSFWDKILHAVSPMVLTAVGYGLICILLKETPVSKVSPWLFLLMGFAFAGLCGIFWEFWEFMCDSIGGMNLQRYATLDGTDFIGREALMDTMGDLLTNTIGAALMGVIAYFQGRGKPEYFDSYRIQKINNK
ncbi:hypothetical protein A5886_001406 [Enterococcus sp. 8G7_MSG3316]|uniref:Uncharacterized protein n=1 Tax=Candidatus Enterococcus testudinis TaxID=1834191 RepID=A0A242A5Y7_9ENTE|nr:hypothetical protein [Enterococcus sp. 8G7_MSG3316]OTN76329.1 hypothetical protein A5886_001406 [Enterococcus sp. 8G7_MSG3316]